MPFSNSKRPVTTTDKSKEDFMKLIAQEVRMYNKSGDDFQRVCVLEEIFIFIDNIISFFLDN